jgi:DNA-directed RNA polymerase subunit omega
MIKSEYVDEATKRLGDPNLVVNVVSKRVKQLGNGAKPLVESLEKLGLEEIALREILENKLLYEYRE